MSHRPSLLVSNHRACLRIDCVGASRLAMTAWHCGYLVTTIDELMADFSIALMAVVMSEAELAM